jgi:phosphoribosylformimino-5-aminoimidazole carboxamide ribotide isomerase
MRILPVLDVKGGLTVRGSAGRREHYKPLNSPLAHSADPLDVAQGFRSHLGLDEIYLADLDAIAGQYPSTHLYTSLRRRGSQLWVDAGIRRVQDAHALIEVGVEKVIAGLETLESVKLLEALCRKYGPSRIVFSLDLMPERLIDETSRDRIVADAVRSGVRSLIVLNLSRVGLAQGTGTEELCRNLAASYPEVEILAGGGIRSLEDLQNLQRDGVRGALIASAFHDGKIRREHLDQLES